MNNKMILIVLLLIASFMGIGFVGYYVTKENSNIDKRKLLDKNLSSTNNISTSTINNYFSKIQVTFTDIVYAPDQYQSNPRLKIYVGKIQNKGDKIVNYLNIKVQYLDKDNKAIWEENIPFNKTLKANFIEEFQFGGLKVPSDWAGEVNYEITELRFQGSPETETYQSQYYKNEGLNRPLQRILLFP